MITRLHKKNSKCPLFWHFQPIYLSNNYPIFISYSTHSILDTILVLVLPDTIQTFLGIFSLSFFFCFWRPMLFTPSINIFLIIWIVLCIKFSLNFFLFCLFDFSSCKFLFQFNLPINKIVALPLNNKH